MTAITAFLSSRQTGGLAHIGSHLNTKDGIYFTSFEPSVMPLIEKAGATREIYKCSDITDPVIKAAGIGYAVQNAVDELKAVAERITVSNDQNAIAKIIYEL